jgi:hypothetical protein
MEDYSLKKALEQQHRIRLLNGGLSPNTLDQLLTENSKAGKLKEKENLSLSKHLIGLFIVPCIKKLNLKYFRGKLSLLGNSKVPYAKLTN